MKTHTVWIVLWIAVLLGFSSSAHARWVLYDNFNSGTIDPAKWSVDDSSAVITVEDGRAKFVHQPGFPGDSSYLIFNADRPIRGIAAKVELENCSGDVRGRLMIDKYSDGDGNEVYMEMFIGHADGIGFRSGYWNPPDHTTRYLGKFKETAPIEGVEHKFVLIVTDQMGMSKADDLGWILFSSPEGESLSPLDDPFYGIGTRSTNGDGPCTVYFDDVYVLY